MGGNDLLNGRQGNDLIDGGAGNDRVSYANASAGVTATLPSAATIGSSSGADGGDRLLSLEVLRGSAYADELRGSAGANTVEGLGDDDWIVGREGDDVLNGGTGPDTVGYEEASSAVTVNLSLGTATGGAGNDKLSAVENVSGSAHADVLTGSRRERRHQGPRR